MYAQALNNTRNSNIELLRIFSMFFIVLHHCITASGFPLDDFFSWNKFLAQVFAFGGKVGVNIFVMISGFFLINTRFRLRRLVKLIFCIQFYAVAILVFAGIKDLDTFTDTNIFKSLIVIGSTNWFAHYYLILYLFSPFINAMYNNISKQLYIIFLILGGMFWFIIPTIFQYIQIAYIPSFGFSNLILFVYLYGVGAYIRRYISDNVLKYKYIFIIIGSGMYIAIYFLIDVLENNHLYILGNKFAFAFDDRNLFFLLISLGIFLLVISKRGIYNRYINIIASTTFGIYLIHDNILFREFLWRTIFHSQKYFYESYFILYLLTISLIVFICCSLIDYFRMNFIESEFFEKYGGG